MVLTAAVMIGVNRARGLPPLRQAENDASDLARVLAGPLGPIGPNNVRVLAGVNATRTAVVAAFDWARRMEPQNFLVSFSGHGGMDSLALADDLLLHAELARLIESVGANRTVALLDTCHAGTFSSQFSMLEGVGAIPDISWTAAFARALPGIRLLLAARSTETAAESSRNGMFTRGLLEAFRTLPGVDYGHGRYITAEQAIGRACEYVRNVTGGRQNPEAFGPIADFPLVRARTGTVTRSTSDGIGWGAILFAAAAVIGGGYALSRLPKYDP